MLVLYVVVIGICALMILGRLLLDVWEKKRNMSELSGELQVTGSGEVIIDEELTHLRHRRDHKHTVEVGFKPENPHASCVPHSHDQLRWELVERRRRGPRESVDLDLKVWWQVHAARTIVWKITFH